MRACPKWPPDGHEAQDFAIAGPDPLARLFEADAAWLAASGERAWAAQRQRPKARRRPSQPLSAKGCPPAPVRTVPNQESERSLARRLST